MQEITFSKATELTSPNPVTLICTKTPDGRTNLATVSWYTPVSFKPPMLAFVMSKTSYSGECLRDSGRAALVFPGAELSKVVMQCGSVSGRTLDKPFEFGIRLAPVGECPVQVPVHSRLVFDCALDQAVEVSDHYLYICNIHGSYADESKSQIYALNGYASVGVLA